MSKPELKNENQVPVGTYTMPCEADLVWSLLEAHGIEVFPADYYTIYIDWLYSNALGGIKLRVSEGVAAEARAIIAAALAEGEDLHSTYSEGPCPHCGKSDTAPVVRGKGLAIFFMFILNLPIFWPWTRLRCSTCGHMWRE